MRELSVVKCGLVEYETASRWQDDLHARRVSGAIGDVLLLLEHPNVYTMGRKSAEEHLLMDEGEMAARGVRLCRTDRGGSITFHGPGQLVAYPIVDLRRDESYFVDVIRYVRLLEQAVKEALHKWDIDSTCRDGMTGVWVGREKVAAIGVRISRGVAKHGVALNVCVDLELFGGIVPCGLKTEGVTSLQRLLGRPVTVAEAAGVLEQRLSGLLGLNPIERTLADVGIAIDLPAGDAAGTGKAHDSGRNHNAGPAGDGKPRPAPDVVRPGSNEAKPRPGWLKIRAKQGRNYSELKGLMRGLDLHTVCQEAGCPNIYECWEAREATFLILGQQCTRRCGFCDIATGKPGPLDLLEPGRVAEAVDLMGLEYAVITGVERDDVAPMAAARIWAATIKAIKGRRPTCGVEVLTGDLKGDRESVRAVLDAGPDVFAHNLETVRRLHKSVRPGFRYARSLEVLALAKQMHPTIPTKSNLIVGLGETRLEVIEALEDLRDSGVDIVTVGQYLSPSADHLPVRRWITPEEFAEIKAVGESLGFAWVESGPLVRSSLHAGKQHAAAALRLRSAGPAAARAGPGGGRY